mmetsp:Transcript_42780/g.48613  ORF Transcript_42780/g.48613 Transcript_42780/m.48613 type:complete len:238 (+) Transcript_42780:135-848(+)|eukprot:CAMPEP_0194175470 /NCGR_PEP_ID=MMETSP0154-20130528/9480_1 /TAXON_ID=1049557 /ORGANISM="Thalassiothrix antarctica, Strain L6-D1" /LENGTH=237 /DNA_ID=CAMNT_0038889251 /DNA_START=51 /DNA_END=767 /DNA_ORIENTATION=+
MTSQRKTKLRYEIGSMVVPGDRLGSIRHNYIPGEGTYARGGHIFSCLVGKLAIDTTSSYSIVSVEDETKAAAVKQVLKVGQLVLCRVQRVMMLQANIIIVAAEGVKKLKHKPDACIRRDDVRRVQSTSKDKNWTMESCFHPEDWVLGRIVSLGDSRRYMISTAETELGVVRAVSASTSFEIASVLPMKPISWKEMECPLTGKKEYRKVAKPNHEFLSKVLGNTTIMNDTSTDGIMKD